MNSMIYKKEKGTHPNLSRGFTERKEIVNFPIPLIDFLQIRALHEKTFIYFFFVFFLCKTTALVFLITKTFVMPNVANIFTKENYVL